MGIWGKLTGSSGKRPRAVNTDIVAHSEIYLPQPKGARITEHIFQNPDETSPVAAVSCKLQDGNFQLELYSRDGRFEETTQRMVDADMDCFQKGAKVHDSSLGSFPNSAPIHPQSHRLIGFEEAASLTKNDQNTDAKDAPFAKYFTALETTPLLSGNSAKREAMVRKIYETIPLLEATVQRATPSSNAIG